MTSAVPNNGPLQQLQRFRHDIAEAASTVGHAAAATGRGTTLAVRHPGITIERARKVSHAMPMLWHSVKPALTGRVGDWRTEYAYTLGVQAFTYGFPYVYYARLRHQWVTQRGDTATTPYAAVNHFWHAERLIDASSRIEVPNNDTLYSTAWVDLRTEPVILSHPEMGERYFTFELVGVTSDNFDYIGQRATGSRAGHFALVGPGWEGNLPDGVRRTATAPTPWVLIWGRTLVDGDPDLPNVHALQRQYRLTPLSLFGRTDAEVPERRDVLEPIDAVHDPLGPWKTLNAMLAENPPPQHHGVLLKQFADIGVGPGLDVEAQPEAVKEGLARAAATAEPLVKQQMLSGDWARMVNGWRYPPPQTGRFGDDFLRRAGEQALVGAANDPAESVYLVNYHDPNGEKLSSGHYELRFAPGQLPPVDAFWSLTVYKEDLHLVPNAAGRYSVGDRTEGLIPDPDGGLTLHLQAQAPDAAREANWLPTPEQGTWFVALRMYRPRPEVVDATWQCPPLNRVS